MRTLTLLLLLIIVSNAIGQKEFYLKFYDAQTNELISPNNIVLSPMVENARFECEVFSQQTAVIKGMKKKQYLCYSLINSTRTSCRSVGKYKKRDTTNIYLIPLDSTMEIRWNTDSIKLTNKIIEDTLKINNQLTFYNVLADHIDIPEYVFDIKPYAAVTIYVSFNVDSNGIANKFQIIKGFHKHTDREIVKCIWKMPILKFNETPEFKRNSTLTIPIKLSMN